MQTPLPTAVIVLAAGRGTRMRSERPKVLQALAGRPLLAHVLETAQELKPAALRVVYGYGGDAVREALVNEPVDWVEQSEQRGTGDATRCGLTGLPAEMRAIVLCGDVPLMQAESLLPLLEETEQTLSLLTVELADPTGYGRIVRSNANGEVVAIVEERDATPQQRQIRETNTGILAAPVGLLRGWLEQLRPDNAQGEYYLTDVVAMAVAAGYSVRAHRLSDPLQASGVNSFVQLAEVEQIWQARARDRLLRQGLAMPVPTRVLLRGQVEHGRDCSVDVDCVLEGRIELADRVRIGPGVVLRNVTVGSDSVIAPYCVLEDVELAERCQVGPFAHLRPGTRLAPGARVGNFVEMKAATLGRDSKANHLSYIGDAQIGERVNIGAGTITCNYDGERKHPTKIADDAFIGSGTQLVAPLSVGEGATVGAGSTLTRDAPARQLTLARCRQQSKSEWRRPGLTPDPGSAEDRGEGPSRGHTEE
ncbi:bifunctional UDP-N-acetylglucosamine diphosphorylase/glucosamine-1-phosphate N-acetyltransferase GlmU [Halorhodospira abdelmalekii]|uniref:bifunctional UDP-N-acetylglucosamine diphosphorylase/glucosamine-1-phosphate N-acetyltransferase GlmU n=1 Tax=Halorhodospira abdelmalekii TaxID=421629 RepID=UPI0030845078